MSEAIVIGGGFYGTMVALYLARQRSFRDVRIFERERALLARASFNNQARIHNGYHYPRSFVTAFRSRVNFPVFNEQFGFAVERRFTKLYAIARAGSKINARQFERACAHIGAKLQPARPELANLFSARTIEAVFEAEEHAFDATKLREWLERELDTSGVRVERATRVHRVEKSSSGLRVFYRDAQGNDSQTSTQFVFNCTYSGLSAALGQPAGGPRLKHELTELALVELPEPLQSIGITVMDGPFFSCIPFPSRGLHTLSHVRFTPHFALDDSPAVNPYQVLANYPKETRVDRMIRDAGRFVPALDDAKPVDSLFEVKTVLAKNEADDGRPILFERNPSLPNVFSVLGSKIDNIYDVLQRLEHEPLER